jgi:hypothetical protein
MRLPRCSMQATVAPVLIVCVMEACVAYAADALGGAIVTQGPRPLADSVERSLGREIERDPAERGGPPKYLLGLLRPEAAIRRKARTT